MEEVNRLTDKSDIIKSIVNYKNDLDVQKLESLYFSKSFSEILSVSRRELSHSAFIHWLLDNKENHSLSLFPIQKFIEIILFRTNNNLIVTNPIFDYFLTENYLIKSVKIEREKGLDGYGRLDLYGEVVMSIKNEDYTLKLIIENKVESKENNDQTVRYFEYFEKIKRPNDINLYIYLSAISTLELNQLTEPQCNCKNFIQINYQFLVDYLLEPALNQDISDRTKFIIKEYLQSLSQPSLNILETNQKQNIIMALGKEEQELLSNFWKKNEKLILSAMYAISIDESQEPETREITNKFLKESSNRDYSTINLYFDGVLINEKFKKSDIGYFTVKLLDAKQLINDDVYHFIRNDKSCTFQLIKQMNEVLPNELRKYRTGNSPELIYKGEKYFVARNWGKINGIDNTEKFIEKISNRFPQIRFERNN